MSEISRIWDIQSFQGGESDDIYKGPKDSFYFWENVEVRKDLSSTQLAGKLVDKGWTISGTMTAMENLETLGVGTTSGIIVCTATGNIYLNGTLKHTLATGTTAFNTIIGIGVMTVSGTQYVYYVSQADSGTVKVHRSTTDLTGWNDSYKSFTVSSSLPYPTTAYLINSGDYLHIAIKNKIVNIYNVAEVVSDGLVIPEKETISGFTQFQNTYKLYANVGSNGIQYTWDGTAILPDYRQVWRNQPVLWVVNDGAFDYAILGFSNTYSALYLISGTQKQELRVNLEASASSRILDGYMSIRRGMVYINGGKSGESNNYGVYTYGNYYPWTPKSLVQQYSLASTAFLFHAHSTAESYFASGDGKVYWIEHNNPATTLWVASTGYVVSNMYQGNSWEEKKFTKMKISYRLQAGTSINVYLRTALGTSWSLAKAIDLTKYPAKKSVTVFAEEIKALNLGNFYDLQMKVELNGATYFTPSFLRSTVWMEVVNPQ